ncbi:MAG: SbcC/MukB-like Walker B domain-containing protein, partial [Kofleriaceae bacterium]
AERDVNDARPLIDEARRSSRALEELVARLENRSGDVANQLAVAQTDHARLVAERSRAIAARSIQDRLTAVDLELAKLVAEEATCRARSAVATTHRTAARQERTRAHQAYDRASHGLADLQAGIDELVRRAHGHRQLVRRLDDARLLLARPALSADDAADALAELDRERVRNETDLSRIERDSRDLEARRADHTAALRALTTIDPTYVVDADVHARARSTLARVADREAARARLHEIERERVEAVQLATRQAHARALAAALAVSDDVVAELAATEQQLRELALAEETRRADARTRARLAHEVRTRLATLDDRSARWHLAETAVRRLAGARGPLTNRAEVTAQRDRLIEELHALGDREKQLEGHRQVLRERAHLIEQSGTNLDPELLRLRDELGGELLASRFEDLDVAAASWVEARLGPLTGALIVDDLDAAVAAALASDRLAPTVWLVKAGTVLDVEPPEDLGDITDVVTTEPFGARVTRRLPRASLGRRARERQVQEVHDAIDRDGAALDEIAARTALVASWRRELEVLETHVEVLADGDPETEHTRLTESSRRSRARSTTSTRRGLPSPARGSMGYAACCPMSGCSRSRPRRARTSSLRCRRLLQIIPRSSRESPVRAPCSRDLIDVLRSPPPSDAELAAQATRANELADRLDALAAARAALDDVIVHRHAAAFGDAEAALDARAGLAPALEAQHAGARAAVEAAAEAEATAETVWEAATRAVQAAEATRLAALAHRDRVAAELASLGPISDAAADLVAYALAARIATLDAEARVVVRERAVNAERLSRSAQAIEDARDQLASATRQAVAPVAAWSELRDLAQSDGVLHSALAGSRTDRSSIQLSADAWSKREVLLDRIERARGGDDIVSEIRDADLDGPGYLAAWRTTRNWLRARVPAQVADVDEPLLALERLRDHLDVLERRLGRQEHDLRGASEDVARGIEVQVRRAHGQVRRLNTQLEGIQFGSIHGIRVEIRRIERMEQILRALRLGEAQELLFTPAVPIEEALDEIFRRYGGGGRHGGQRLLDYREYLELAVEIRRQASGAWETASPTKLSTGEAIGVGAALMMVVLTEWERDANLLRARRTGGSLRFLFLDEANRLSRDNLGVLFDLCKSLDLQLLIAAPEVARAEGNTTYRLVRHVTDEGREEVIVSGRRSIEQVQAPLVETGAGPSRLQ